MTSPYSEDESVPPVPDETAMFVMEVQQKRLCNRCRSLDLDHLRANMRKFVLVSSLEFGCCYCDNFRMIVSEIVGENRTHLAEMISITMGGIDKRRFITLTFGDTIGEGGNPIISQCESYELLPVEYEQKEFCQTAGSRLDDEPAELSKIQSALETCRTSHPDCHRKGSGMPIPLKVLHCQSRTLHTIDPDTAYVALSYVWGNVPVRSLLDPQALPLPKTIEDALSVCLRVGIQYMWVDRYCIDQGNAQEKHSLISQMDKIYRGAEFTIIAAAGESPNHGLPGVNGTPRHRRIEFQTRKSRFIATRKSHGQVSSSTWSKRGWTYQEVLLSPRRLYFTNWEIIFECASLSALEFASLSRQERISRMTGYGWQHHSNISIYPWLESELSFYHIYPQIYRYCGRHLTYPEDAIHGIEAVLCSFQFIYNPFRVTSNGRQTIKHLYGIPCTSHEPSRNESFMSSLLWEGYSLEYPRESVQIFPSWSWAITKSSAQGEMRYSLGLDAHKIDDITWPISITVTHKTRGEESLLDFGAQDDYMSYHPWFRIDTWLLSGQAQHPVTAHDDFRFDKIKPSKTLDTDSIETDSIVVVNLMTYGGPWNITSKFLLVEQTAPGDYKRLGLFSITIQSRMDLHSSMALVKAAALKKVQEIAPDMEWELQERTVRFV
jgi:hypothetical protein